MGRQDSTSWIKGRYYRQAKTASKSMFRALIVLSLLSAMGSGVALIQHWQAQAQAQTDGQNHARGEAVRSSDRATNQIRFGHQPDDSESARRHYSRKAARARFFFFKQKTAYEI